MFPVAWVREAEVGAGSRDCGICASGRASDAPLCITVLSSGGCATTLDCCITVEGVTFEEESTKAPARELEERPIVGGSVDTGTLGIGRLSCTSRFAKTEGRRSTGKCF